MVNDFVFSALNVMLMNEKGVTTEVTNFHGVQHEINENYIKLHKYILQIII